MYRSAKPATITLTHSWTHSWTPCTSSTMDYSSKIMSRVIRLKLRITSSDLCQIDICGTKKSIRTQYSTPIKELGTVINTGWLNISLSAYKLRVLALAWALNDTMHLSHAYMVY